MTKNIEARRKVTEKNGRKIKDYRLFFLWNWTSLYNICTK